MKSGKGIYTYRRGFKYRVGKTQNSTSKEIYITS
nr:MAG TPA: hypothetical protein [Caudoviricetes sp.]